MRALLYSLIFLFGNLLRADDAPSYESRTIEGWSVKIQSALIAKQKDATETALGLLKKQLVEIKQVVPAAAVEKLQKITLWFSPRYPGVGGRAEYHPDAGWLRGNGRDPAMAKGVEFTDVDNFAAEMDRMPNFTLHELAHAYHDWVLSFDHAEIRNAYEAAKQKKLYDNVERWHGTGKPLTKEKAYAMTNHKEYFAETTEAFFVRNDFFPFTKAELKAHDPVMYEVLARVWAAPAEKKP